MHRISNRIGALRSCVKNKQFNGLILQSFSNKTSAHAFPEFKLTFLGTGGSNPSRFRGSSCTVLNLGGESWVFDAGEGSMPRMPGNASIAETSRIFITHMHADHILGLPSMVRKVALACTG